MKKVALPPVNLDDPPNPPDFLNGDETRLSNNAFASTFKDAGSNDKRQQN